MTLLNCYSLSHGRATAYFWRLRSGQVVLEVCDARNRLKWRQTLGAV